MRADSFSGMGECIALESEFGKWIGAPYAVSHSNATSAILCALLALEIGAGDEVIVPSATYWASALPVLHCGAVPVFAEVEPRTLGLDPSAVEAAITARTRAVVAVHLCGIPADVEKLQALCEKHSLHLIEDAAQAHGARVGKVLAGTIGRVGIFSFEATKLIPGGEGGMLVTSDKAVYQRALALGHHERLASLKTEWKRYASTGLGFNFRMAPLSAALIRAQLARFPATITESSRRMRELGTKLEALGEV